MRVVEGRLRDSGAGLAELLRTRFRAKGVEQVLGQTVGHNHLRGRPPLGGRRPDTVEHAPRDGGCAVIQEESVATGDDAIDIEA